jgi:hypothetical protein
MHSPWCTPAQFCGNSLARMAVTIFVSKPLQTSQMGGPSAAASKMRQREIMGAHPDAKMLNEGNAKLQQGSESCAGRKATFAFEQVFARKQQRVGSELYVFGFVGGEWIVKYRFTYPGDLDAANRIAAFMRDLTLTIPPES